MLPDSSRQNKNADLMSPCPLIVGR